MFAKFELHIALGIKKIVTESPTRGGGKRPQKKL
jgi:hypothetical protein